ncbi:MAG: ComF family protein [Muribaculaceae bacterium]|nr:ComF family protein [Muribaculaceae bacterium]
MFRLLIDTLFPPRCVGCGSYLLAGEDYICLQCISDLPRTLYYLQPESNPMIDRFAGIFPFERATSWLYYIHGNITSHIIHTFKYHRQPQLARRIGALMAEEMTMNGYFYDIDYIMPVPQHWTRRMHRGYNQTEYLADGISEVTDLPVLDNLYAARRHRSQTAFSLAERRANPTGSFSVHHPDQLSDSHILVIDDVCTTGATLIEACTALHTAAPTARLSILTLASTI